MGIEGGGNGRGKSRAVFPAFSPGFFEVNHLACDEFIWAQNMKWIVRVFCQFPLSTTTSLFCYQESCFKTRMGKAE